MAAMDNGRAAGWNKLTPEEMALLKDKFVAYPQRFGSTGYASQDAWSKAVNKNSKDCGHANRLYFGTFWSVVTASGAPVISPKKTLAGALEAFQQLPEADRQPIVEDRGPHNPNLYYADQEPPPKGMFIAVYCRPLEKAPDGTMQAAKRIDLTEFGGRPGGNSMQSRFSEPQREWLWLTEAEARSLEPGERKKGETYPFPPAIRQRLFLFYLYNWFTNSGGGYWGPRLLRSGELNLTVEERTGDTVRLRLQGSAHFQGEIGKGVPPHGGHMFGPNPESGQKGVPDPYEIFYDARLYGTVEYDTAKKQFTRFDAVALGDYRGHWGLSLKVLPIPVGFAFQLDPRDLPQGRHAPFALSSLKDFYWKADEWQPKR
jgi:hypothetical protein